MGSGFLRVTDKNLSEADVPLCSGQVRIEGQGPLELGNAFVEGPPFRMPPMISWASASSGL